MKGILYVTEMFRFNRHKNILTVSLSHSTRCIMHCMWLRRHIWGGRQIWDTCTVTLIKLNGMDILALVLTVIYIGRLSLLMQLMQDCNYTWTFPTDITLDSFGFFDRVVFHSRHYVFLNRISTTTIDSSHVKQYYNALLPYQCPTVEMICA